MSMEISSTSSRKIFFDVSLDRSTVSLCWMSGCFTTVRFGNPCTNRLLTITGFDGGRKYRGAAFEVKRRVPVGVLPTVARVACMLPMSEARRRDEDGKPEDPGGRRRLSCRRGAQDARGSPGSADGL